MENNILYIAGSILILLVLSAFIYFRSQKKWRRVYKKKGPYLLSDGEKRFFDVLEHSVTPDMYVCPKVRIADLVEMAIDRTDKEFWPKFNQISQKHVDFVICNKATFAPLLIVELDGGSHNENSRSLRDILVDNVFKDAEIPMLHVAVAQTYQQNHISQLISQSININQSTSVASL